MVLLLKRKKLEFYCFLGFIIVFSSKISENNGKVSGNQCNVEITLDFYRWFCNIRHVFVHFLTVKKIPISCSERLKIELFRTTNFYLCDFIYFYHCYDLLRKYLHKLNNFQNYKKLQGYIDFS